MKHRFKIFLTFSFLFLTVSSFTQENIWEDYLREEVEVENPVYKPVIGFGVGVLNFMGDINNDFTNPLEGNLGYKVNVSTFLDNKHHFRANFFLMIGSLSGNQRSIDDLSLNRNFQSDIINFGIDINYSFGHFYRRTPILRPFISLGVENMTFNSKSDLEFAPGQNYHYWSDGTIRDIPQGTPAPSRIISRNYDYETDLRGTGQYSQNVFAIPVDVGFEFQVSDRIMMKLGTSLHYSFTDMIDNIRSSGTGVLGIPKNDMFTFSYVTFHLDLFSDAKTIIVEKLFAEIDFDYTFYGDEDNDGVFDGWDLCPGTPRGVEVDSVGCPLDRDGDGVPDYMDREPNSSPGAIVDEYGIEIQDDAVIGFLSLNAVSREEAHLYAYTDLGRSAYRRYRASQMPAKFRDLDLDGDGYISYDEVMNAIDDFFDFDSDLEVEDIYELTEFFFTQ